MEEGGGRRMGGGGAGTTRERRVDANTAKQAARTQGPSRRVRAPDKGHKRRICMCGHRQAVMSFTDTSLSTLSASRLLARTFLGCSTASKHKENMVSGDVEQTDCNSGDEDGSSGTRHKREFTPDERKDEGYWDKRRKNNEAAKRSREKRRANDMVLETRVLGLLEENAHLRAELLALKFRFGLVKDPSN
ncbi:hypothetical protein CRUP_036955, partial [Coryphaenoides rupestris]